VTPRLPELRDALAAAAAELDHAAVRCRQARGDLERLAAAGDGEAGRLAHRLADYETALGLVRMDVVAMGRFVGGCLKPEHAEG
jgi:hypothetical protein